ncbi:MULTISPECIES: ATP-binding protein [unclassified Bacillus (in: firmicutes)]|uniref:ATP-binding protein n=1 Tax=unclassified Bacillus (in: firmicutes) TaxID=185979 RepID=UPI0008F2B1A5|nr:MULTISPECIES: ATP-binding protein [unclassified Bacillus (in: firmicutes)]SFA77117.1 two-component system, sporulation sensor kinase D [Bacillus sp. UNCCL13]SFQ67013.1 two-component system, sporulation sensor kinase D [Bacillus sp. cl95]
MTNKKNLLIYIFVVIVPFLLISSLTVVSTLKKDEKARIEHANWIATVHQKSWDKLIAETVTSMEMLSLTANTSMNNPEKLDPILKRTHQKDPRYGGIYVLDKYGTVIAGSNGLLVDTNLSKNTYIKNVIKTKDTIISNRYETLINRQKVIGLASPILDEDRNLNGLMVAHIRIDYIQNVMKILTPDTKILVYNGTANPMMKINIESPPKTYNNSWVSKPIERLPWSIYVKVPERKYKSIIENVYRPIFFILIISNILFLLIKYILLWEQSLREKKQNEQQKLELVGTLAASTAHEIRNPLTGVKGLIQLLSEKYTDPEDKYYFEVIDTEISRINEIVSEFLILGKPTAEKTDLIHIHMVIKELQPLIISEGNLFNAKCTWLFSDEEVIVECNKDQLKQVILNVTKNAFESISEDGNLNIQISKKEKWCEICIRDNGSGMTPEELTKIFTPFYTSKETGTGLGLVVCKRIVESFKGKIEVSSKKNEGTDVVILLPLVV